MYKKALDAYLLLHALKLNFDAQLTEKSIEDQNSHLPVIFDDFIKTLDGIDKDTMQHYRLSVDLYAVRYILICMQITLKGRLKINRSLHNILLKTKLSKEDLFNKTSITDNDGEEIDVTFIREGIQKNNEEYLNWKKMFIAHFEELLQKLMQKSQEDKIYSIYIDSHDVRSRVRNEISSYAEKIKID